MNSFQKSKDPLDSIGIGKNSKEYIINWFKTYAPLIKYKIKSNLEIIVFNSIILEHQKINLLPDNLIIEGCLNIDNCPSLYKLPNNLWVGTYLLINNTNITEIPDDLTVETHMHLGNNKIVKLPDKLIVNGTLNLENNPISELPKSLTVKGDLSIINTNINSNIPYNVLGKVYYDIF